jgi:thioredoxin-related protein
MKSVLIAFTSLFFLTNISAQTDTKIRWYSIEDAIKLNEKAPKKFLIDIYTDWCGWCKKMDAETFNYAEIAQYINAHYYPVKFNAESSEDINFAGTVFEGSKGAGGRKPPHKLAVALFNGIGIGYPAIAYLTEKLEIIGTVPGYKTPQQIEPLLHYIAENKYKSIGLSDFEKTFTSQLKK